MVCKREYDIVLYIKFSGLLFVSSSQISLDLLNRNKHITVSFSYSRDYSLTIQNLGT